MTAELTRARARQPRTYFTPEGTLYAVHGPGGAISLVIPDVPGDESEPVLIHARAETSLGGYGSCTILPEGKCWADAGYTGGMAATEKFITGGEAALYGELEDWYRSRFGEEAQQ
jgi:hypothetical protein